MQPKLNNKPYGLTIASEYWEKQDYDELTRIIDPSIPITKNNLARWSVSENDPMLTMLFTYFTGPFVDVIISTLSVKVWEVIIDFLSKKMSEKKYPHLVVNFSNERQTLNFNLTSTSEDTIHHALDTIKDVIHKEYYVNDKEFFYFDVESNNWERLKHKKISEVIQHAVIGSKHPVVKDGKEIHVSEEQLPMFAKEQIGLPMHLGHHGPLIGIVVDSWVVDHEVKVKIGIFEDVSEEQKEEIRKMKGVSLGGTYNNKAK